MRSPIRPWNGSRLVRRRPPPRNLSPPFCESRWFTEGSQQVGPDFSTFGPVLDLSISGDQVYVNWGWQGYGAFLDQTELHVDRADGKGFVLLAIDTTPGYIDTQPFPSAPAEWTYQAIYPLADSRVGQWSNPVSVAVGV